MKQNFTHKGLTRLYFIMRVSLVNLILLVTSCLQVISAAPANGQSIYDTFVSIDADHISMRKVFRIIEDQTQFLFVYTPDVLDKYTDISLKKNNSSVEEVLNAVLDKLPLVYDVSKNNIVVHDKEQRSVSSASSNSDQDVKVLILVQGIVTEEISGVGMPGVSIIIKGTTNGTTTDSDGHFSIEARNDDALVISSVGYKNQEINVSGRTIVNVQMQEDVSSLKEIVINGGYYTTTTETKIGNISKVSGDDIKDQPLTSPLLGLAGRAAGVDVFPSNGVPGSSTVVRIRGRNSLRFDGGYPLYVVDGVPIESSPLQSSSMLVTGGYDPLSSINPADIESIEILKDADATAIYGSRGANGVVLITTRRSSKGKTSADFNVYRGIGEIGNKLDLLNTPEYLAMRREAFVNNGNESMTEDNAPDFVVWDTTRYTDWQDVLLGGSSDITDVQGGISGGNSNTSFRFSGGYHKETTIFPGDFYFQRFTGSFSINHLSEDKRFSASISANYGAVKNKFFDSVSPVEASFTLPPNAPNLYNGDGTLNWALNSLGGSTWTNPIANFRRTNDAKTGNLMFNAVLSYNIGGGFLIKSNIGYTDLNSSETIKVPLSSYDPAFVIYNTPESQWTNTQRRSWIVEPQVTFARHFGDHGVDAILGTTFQEGSSEMKFFYATGYASDALLGSLSSASNVSILNDDNVRYRYTSIFGRIGYDYKEKYFLNVTARRDGSSRFGDDNRFGNFGSVGGAWIFSKESFFYENIPFVSLGKLRGSFGATGNDQIGDYKYANTYSNALQKYRGAFGLVPSGLFNPAYKWEVSKKIEAALELGFFNNRVSIEMAWYRNRSSNLLIEYQLPGTTGFGSILKNLDAKVENRGLEYTINFRLFDGDKFNWMTSINYSRPRNELVEFKDLERSTYSNVYVVGYPLDVYKLYVSKGVDSETGIYSAVDVDENGIFDMEDRISVKRVGRSYFGGINNTIEYKGFSLQFLLQFVRQTSKRIYTVPVPGQMNNIPRSVYNGRWIGQGDVSEFQKMTTDPSNAAFYSAWLNSDQSIVNSSFLRLKTLSFSYTLPTTFVDKIGVRQCKLYLQGQNLFTVTNYIGVDPETGNTSIPSLRMFSLGIQLGI